MLCDGIGSWTAGLEDSRPAGLVLADLMMVGSQPGFKEQALLGIIYTQGWASCRRELEFGSEIAP